MLQQSYRMHTLISSHIHFVSYRILPLPACQSNGQLREKKVPLILFPSIEALVR